MRTPTCVVTGANQGIGKATALGLAQAGARVVMVCRSRERGERAQADLAEATDPARVSLHLADLGDLSQITALAADLANAYDHIDVLVNNAAIVPRTRTTTAQGFEMQWAVNHLAPFTLTDALLPKLFENTQARIVTVASDAHHRGSIDFSDLQHERRYNRWKTYAATKLANVLFTYALARRLEGTTVTANCLHPGVIGTTLLRQFLPPLPGLKLLTGFFFTSTRAGAQTGIHLAMSPDVTARSGEYFRQRQAVRSSRQTYDRDLQERLWAVSAAHSGAGGQADKLMEKDR